MNGGDCLFLQSALICEKVLQEQDGVLSAIRIIDRIAFIMVLDGQLSSFPGRPATFLISLKSGAARGREVYCTPREAIGREFRAARGTGSIRGRGGQGRTSSFRRCSNPIKKGSTGSTCCSSVPRRSTPTKANVLHGSRYAQSFNRCRPSVLPDDVGRRVRVHDSGSVLEPVGSAQGAKAVTQLVLGPVAIGMLGEESQRIVCETAARIRHPTRSREANLPGPRHCCCQRGNRRSVRGSLGRTWPKLQS